MRYQELDMYWKRIFELEWISLCEGSKAIAALIVSSDGTIISEGTVGTGFVPGLIVVAAIVVIVVSLMKKGQRSCSTKN